MSHCGAVLPQTSAIKFDEPGPLPRGASVLEFRLLYRGRLPAETSRPRLDDKWRIRRYFHPQLRELWNTHPRMKELYMPERSFQWGEIPPYVEQTWAEHIGEEHKVVSIHDHVHRFTPLIRKENYYNCSLEILFLRRDMPGGLIKHGGDIDNRIKVLFDALRMPRETSELEDVPQLADETPFFCLLEDDQYIDHVSVTTDRLLMPKESNESEHDVVLVIRVDAGLYDQRLHPAPI